MIEAEETLQGKTNRNDRLLAIPSGDPAMRSVDSIGDLRPELLEQIERIFKTYGEFKGKQWKMLGRVGRTARWKWWSAPRGTEKERLLVGLEPVDHAALEFRPRD